MVSTLPKRVGVWNVGNADMQRSCIVPTDKKLVLYMTRLIDLQKLRHTLAVYAIR